MQKIHHHHQETFCHSQLWNSMDRRKSFHNFLKEVTSAECPVNLILAHQAYNPVFAQQFMKISILRQITGIHQASITLKVWHLILDAMVIVVGILKIVYQAEGIPVKAVIT